MALTGFGWLAAAGALTRVRFCGHCSSCWLGRSCRRLLCCRLVVRTVVVLNIGLARSIKDHHGFWRLLRVGDATGCCFCRHVS